MRTIRLTFKPDTTTGREMCEAIGRAEGNDLLHQALEQYIRRLALAALRELTK
ncbi:hypothetical protein [Pseudomonas sp. Hg5Tf]|uniref:Uncharacterized protein n=1 Tax=Pseudomonas sp. Hg7Tf TaxID=3236988 RepID=A0AB39I8D0_9PSED|nr:hypothetical protein [Pseudomonas sp. Hg5Tf]MDH2558376.1 hypothetical protein [Pseudomonas sp. Hg5Tf]